MVKKKSKRVRMPAEIAEEMDVLKDKLEIPRTEAIRLRENFLRGNFVARKKKRKGRGKKSVFEIEFPGL